MNLILEPGMMHTDASGTKALCHICGKAFGHLAMHVIKTHSLTCDEYRIAAGLKKRTKLIGPSLADKRRDAMANVPGMQTGIGAEILKSFTPEQRRQVTKSRRVSLEEKINRREFVKSTGFLRSVITRSQIKRKRMSKIRKAVCLTCRKDFHKAGPRKYCSQECYRKSRFGLISTGMAVETARRLKLSTEQVLEIRSSGLRRKELADKYGVSRVHIGLIQRGLVRRKTGPYQ